MDPKQRTILDPTPETRKKLLLEDVRSQVGWNSRKWGGNEQLTQDLYVVSRDAL